MRELATIIVAITALCCSRAVSGEVLIGKLPGASVETPVKPSADAAPTPYSEVTRVIGLLPKPEAGFVDFGCGADARWCIVAAEKWGCKVTGVEIDHARASAARERVRAAGLEHLITIIEGDAITTDAQADVGVCYLYPEVLAKLKPQIEKLKSFASYMHQPPVPSTKNGDTWIYTRPAKQPAYQQPKMAAWGGQSYSGPVCNSPHCAMCNAIRQQLATQQPRALPPAPKSQSGYWKKNCNGFTCWLEWVPTD